MPRDEQPAGACPDCGADALSCRYNLFDRDGLRIDSWEHRCGSCGKRDTRAYRSDESDWQEEGVDPARCPYCQRTTGSEVG